MRIPDKETFKRLSAAGKLGNTFRQWDRVPMDYRGWLTIRARQSSDKALFVPTIHTTDMGKWFAAQGHNLNRVYFQECPSPDTERIVNLEASIGLNGWKAKASDAMLHVLYNAYSPMNLRHDLERNGKAVEGLRAWKVLEQYLEEDLDTLRDIWADYPDATIECSRFTKPVGVQNSQLIVWEARCY